MKVPCVTRNAVWKCPNEKRIFNIRKYITIHHQISRSVSYTKSICRTSLFLSFHILYQSSPHSWRSSHSTNPLSVCLAPTPLRGSKAQHVGWNMDTPRNLGCTGSLWLKSGHFNSFFQLPITMGEITYQGRSTDLSQKYPSPFDR